MRLLLCIIAAEAITQLVCKAEIFDRIRKWLQSTSKFLNDLLSCAYCVSVWIAAFTTVLYYFWGYTYLFIIMLVIHRLSNIVHDIFKIIFNIKIDQVLRRQ
jgi:hypothetical protein